MELKKLNTSEILIVNFLFIIVFLGFSYYQHSLVYLHHLDTAFLIESIYSIQKVGLPMTYLGPAYVDAYSTFHLNAEEVCQSALNANIRGLNVLDSHAYLILYPLALIGFAIDPVMLVACIQAFSYIALLYISYFILRKNYVGIFSSIAFICLIASHPAWNHSSLGDIYLDRLSMPFVLGFLWLSYQMTQPKIKLTRSFYLTMGTLGLLAALTTERVAIMLAIYLVSLLVLYWKNIKSSFNITLIIASILFLICYSLIYIFFFHVSYPGTISVGTVVGSIPAFLKQFDNQTYLSSFLEFIIINFVLFGIFAIFNFRLWIIGLGTMLPNILTSIGGAEKVGWTTHYHCMYFPFLIFASLIGLIKLWSFLKKYNLNFLLFITLVLLSPYLLSYSPRYKGTVGVVHRIYDFYVKGDQSYEKYKNGHLFELDKNLPKNSKVSTFEGLTPILFKDRNIYYYPLGIDLADYVVVTKIPDNDSFYYTGAINYIGQSIEVNKCLTARLEKAGYDINNPTHQVDNIVILKRKL